MYKTDTDNMGKEVEEGDFVAYNWSGQIATGFVTRVRQGSKYGYTRTIYHIECVMPKSNAGKESVVRGGAQCILVLDKASD